MKYTFNKIRLGHSVMGLPNETEKSTDSIIIDFSNHTVKEIIKGEEQKSLWPYVEITKTHIPNIYTLSVPDGKKISKGEEVKVKGYWNDWNFKPKGFKKLVVWYYMHKDVIFTSMISGIFCGVVSNIIFYFLAHLL